MRWYPSFALCLFMAAAHGQSIFECKQKDGSTAYQDTPCPGKPEGPPVMTFGKRDAGTPIQQQRLAARVLIDHLLEAGQFAPAMEIARKYGLEVYFQQRMSANAQQDAARLRRGPTPFRPRSQCAPSHQPA